MLWLTSAVALIILPQTIIGVQDDRMYSDDYYEDESLHQTTALAQGKTVAVTDRSDIAGDRRFIAQLLCSSNSMKLTIDRKRLPRGLGLRENVQESNNEDPFCQKTTRNSSHYIHEVLLSCDTAIDVFHSKGAQTYSHEIFLEHIESSSARRPYTVVMDCTKRPSHETNSAWGAGYKVLEIRRGSECSQSCPYGELCIQPDDVTGNLCGYYGSNKTEACECPAEQYSCSKATKGRNPRVVVCISTNRVCDSKYDCPEKDDEICKDIFEEWSNWSPCDCKSGLKSRQRTCRRILSSGESRVSRECWSNSTTLTQTRSCEFRDCTRVECSAKSMKIEIPFELGMTADSVIRNMRISDKTEGKNCLPEVNSTHAIFIVPLHKCGTLTWVDGDMVFYTNTVQYGAEHDKNSVIVREYDHSYTARCQYQRRQTVSMERVGPDSVGGVEVAALQFGEKAGRLKNGDSFDAVQHYSSGDGVFDYKMEIYTDRSYSERYAENDYPLKKRLGERLYVGVSFVSQDEDLTVFTERCVALSSAEMNATDEVESYAFIEGGCAVDSTVTFHNTKKNSFSDRYSIQSFKFLESRHPYIYFRCDVIVCDSGEEDPACQRNCLLPKSGEKRKKRSSTEYSHTRSQLVQGPIVVYEEDEVFDMENTKGSAQIFSFVERQERFSFDSSKKGQTSTILLPAIIGVVCLGLGLAVGLFLSRRKKRANPNDKSSQKQENTAQDEAETVMMENC